MGMNSFLNCLAALLAPVIVNIFVENDTWNEWYWVWMSHFVILFLSNLVFQIYAKGEPAEWTKKTPGKDIVVDFDDADVIIIKF